MSILRICFTRAYARILRRRRGARISNLPKDDIRMEMRFQSKWIMNTLFKRPDSLCCASIIETKSRHMSETRYLREKNVFSYLYWWCEIEHTIWDKTFMKKDKKSMDKDTYHEVWSKLGERVENIIQQIRTIDLPFESYVL